MEAQNSLTLEGLRNHVYVALTHLCSVALESRPKLYLSLTFLKWFQAWHLFLPNLLPKLILSLENDLAPPNLISWFPFYISDRLHVSWEKLTCTRGWNDVVDPSSNRLELRPRRRSHGLGLRYSIKEFIRKLLYWLRWTNICYSDKQPQNLSILPEKIIFFSLLLHIQHGSKEGVCLSSSLWDSGWWKVHLDLCFHSH